MTAASMTDAREASRETVTGRFGPQTHSESGEVDTGPVTVQQPGQKSFALAIHQSAVITAMAASLAPAQRPKLEAQVDVLTALVTPGDPDARDEARGRLFAATEGPSWGVGSDLRQTVGSMSHGEGDRSPEEMSEVTAWLTDEVLARSEEDLYRVAVAEHMWRLTHPSCKATKRRRHAAAVDWALLNATTAEQSLQLIGLRCDGFAA